MEPRKSSEYVNQVRHDIKLCLMKRTLDIKQYDPHIILNTILKPITDCFIIPYITSILNDMKNVYSDSYVNALNTPHVYNNHNRIVREYPLGIIIKYANDKNRWTNLGSILIKHGANPCNYKMYRCIVSKIKNMTTIDNTIIAIQKWYNSREFNNNAQMLYYKTKIILCIEQSIHTLCMKRPQIKK
jgi:hypothetical protein